MQCSNRILSKNSYIEIILNNKNSNLKDILDYIIKNTDLSINDFEIDFKCSIPKFIIYKDKEEIYINQLYKIETEIQKLYENNIIKYAGYQ